ncbi:VWA domain-containing protein [Chthonobacter albigriseus]|uniref:VWA domain-containing protein n=1 Tax=Chthonobacter albigriseus TaxID=1683161 RepID=UPI0015EF34FD|nr:VWA domain-containing protein [Chthonobacter albigriseus]
MSTLVLLRPWWLLVLPVVAALALWRWQRGPSAGGWETVMPPAMLAAMRALGHLKGETRRGGFAPVAAAAMITVGLAGPAVPRSDAPLLAESGALLVAIDMSPSVASGPGLADAQAAAADVLSAAGGRPVGLILFSGEAYEAAAPTADPATLESLIAVLGPETMPGKGSRPAAALALARQMFAGNRDADLVLISDGGGLDDAFVAEAERLVAGGARLFVLTVDSTAEGAAGPDRLAAHATAAATALDPAAVLDRLSGPGALGRDPSVAALRFRDLGPLVAGFALVPLAVLFRRRA